MKSPQILLILLFFVSLSAHPGIHDQIEMLDGKISKKESYALYAQRAHLNYEGGMLEAALHDLDAASKLGPTEPLLYEYANIYAAQGKFEKCVTFFDDFIKFNPRLPQAYQGRAHALVKLGRSEAAIKDFETSFKMQKQPHPGLYIEAAELLLETNKDQGKSAIALLDAGMKRLNVQAQLQEKAIKIALRFSHDKDAIARMNALGAERKFNPFWRVELAELLATTGEKSQALQELETAQSALKSKKQTHAVTELLAHIEELKIKYGKAS